MWRRFSRSGSEDFFFPYAKAYARLKATGFQLHWQSAPQGEQAKAKKASKTKYTCPECGQNAWAKPGTLLICGDCYDEGDTCFLLAEPGKGDATQTAQTAAAAVARRQRSRA
jgi:hypothetical protein